MKRKDAPTEQHQALRVLVSDDLGLIKGVPGNSTLPATMTNLPIINRSFLCCLQLYKRLVCIACKTPLWPATGEAKCRLLPADCSCDADKIGQVMFAGVSQIGARTRHSAWRCAAAVRKEASRCWLWAGCQARSAC